MSEQNDTEKSHAASQQKLQKAREKGEIARSNDANNAISFFVIILIILTMGPFGVEYFGQWLSSFFRFSEPDSTINSLHFYPILFFCAVLMIPAIVLVGVLILTRSIIFTPTRIAPKLNKISIIHNAKQKFGRTGFFQFFQNFIKLCIFSAVLAIFLANNIEGFSGFSKMAPNLAIAQMGRQMVNMLAIFSIVLIMVGTIDYIWSWFEHLRKNKMSQQEVKDEHKDAEGDPHLKQTRRQKATQIASNAMLANIPNADVVIVNPTHFAVVLQWSRKKGSAPECVAKGTDHVALKIREIATNHSIAIHSDPPTARALHASVEIGQEIPPQHYQAVAAAIRFAESLATRKRH